jgi:hypothetical protein
MRIELLYFEGCPHYAELLQRLRELVVAEGIEEVELRRVETPEDAERERFLGSPTIRVNGKDVDPAANGSEEYGLECRLYRTDKGLVPAPPEEWSWPAAATRP